MEDIFNQLFEEWIRLINFSKQFGNYYRENLITSNEFIIILTVTKGARKINCKGMQIRDIAAELNMTAPLLSRHIKTLEMKGLVLRERKTDDKKAIFIQVTEKAKEIMLKAKEYNLNMMRNKLKVLKDEQLEAIRDSFHVLNSVL